MKIYMILKKVYYSLKIRMEFNKEAKFFLQNYMLSSEKKENIEYNILMISHSIEKGLCNTKNPRPFGKEKIAELKKLLIKYFQIYKSPAFATDLCLSMISQYLKYYELNNFIDKAEYLEAKSVYNLFDYNSKECGKSEYMPIINLNSYLEFTKSRHSVRKYKQQAIENSKVEYCIKCALQSPSACNRQMVKVHVYYNSSSKIGIINDFAQGLSGFDITNINYAIITYEEAAFLFPGERNQGMFNAGLFSMNLVNAFHEKNIGSCFIQFGNDFNEEQKIKSSLGYKNSERIAVIIAFGYYEDKYDIPASIRKNLADIMIVE